MRFDELFEEKPRKADRSGIYPYHIENGVLSIYMMIPSDPDYGGSEPQMAKGRVDAGESHQESGIREGEEELGLKRNNIVGLELLIKDEIEGLDGIYDIHVFIAEMKNKEDFGKFHYETGWAGWLEIDDALSKGRSNQRKYVEMIKAKKGLK